jgi:hypothetical protein
LKYAIVAVAKAKSPNFSTPRTLTKYGKVIRGKI